MKKYLPFRFGILSLFVIAILLFVTMSGFANTPDGSSGAPATPGGTGTTPAGSPPTNPPPQPPDINAIVSKSRKDYLEELGAESEDDLKKALEAYKKQQKTKPKKATKNGDGDEGNQEPDDSEAQAKIKALEEENSKKDLAIRQSKIENAVFKAVADIKHQLHDKDLFARLIMEAVDLDKNGDVFIKNSEGKPLLNDKGNRKTIAEYITQMLEEKKYLIANSVTGGAGLPPSGNAGLDGGNTKPTTTKALVSDWLKKSEQNMNK
jgi:hypothetical protein